MTTMIALVGDQTLPNFLPVLHFKPDNVVFIYTTRTQQTFENLRTVLEKQKPNVYGVETDPYNIEAIASGLNRGLEKLSELTTQPLVFNLTGGTKTMCLAAYQIAAGLNAPVFYFQSEGGESAVDWYCWQNHQLCHQKREQLPEYLHLSDMLDLQLGRGKDATGKNRWEEKGPTTQKDTHAHLFEEAIANALRHHGYEVMCGVKGKNDQIDIDVMIAYQNQVGIIEAKTADSGEITKLDSVKQLSHAMQYLRGTYIQQFLVMNGKPSANLQMMCEIEKISIICLPNYKRGPNSLSLSQEDTETLLATVNKTMKVKSIKS